MLRAVEIQGKKDWMSGSNQRPEPQLYQFLYEVSSESIHTMQEYSVSSVKFTLDSSAATLCRHLPLAKAKHSEQKKNWHFFPLYKKASRDTTSIKNYSDACLFLAPTETSTTVLEHLK